MKTRCLASSLAFLAITASRSHAQINHWEGDVSGVWNTSGNWSNNIVPTGAGVDVIFNSSGLNQSSLSLSANTTIRSMILYGGNYTLSASAQTLTIQGGGFNQFGSGTFVVNEDILGANSNDLSFQGIGSGAITLNGTINNLAQRLDKWNESNVTLTNTYTTTSTSTTALRVRAGSLILSENGSITQGAGARLVIGAPATYAVGNYINNANAALILDNTVTNNTNRITDGNQIDLSTRSLIEFRGNDSAASSEMLGTLNAGGPGSRIRVDNGTGQSANLTFASLQVNGGANDGNTNTNPTLLTFLVNSGDTLGVSGTTGGRVIFNSAPTLTNGVLKYGVVKTATDVNFATYDATLDNGAALGVKELGSYHTTLINSATAITNANISGSANLDNNRAANALRITSTGAGQSLGGNFNLAIQNAGGLIFQGTNDYTIGGTGNLDFGSSSAAYAYIDANTLTISKSVRFGGGTSGDFSKAGDGMLVINGTALFGARQVGVDDGASVDDMQISGVFQDSGSSLQKSGLGVLALTGSGDNSSFTKGVALNAGTVVLAKSSAALQNNALGSGTITWQGGTIAARGVAALLSNTVNLGQQGSGASGNQMTGDQNITFSGTVQGSLNSAQTYTMVNNGTGLLTLSGTAQAFNANNASPVTSSLLFGGSGNTTVSGIIRNTDPLFANAGTMTTAVIKDGAGLLTLSGSNSYTGSTSVNAGYLRLDHANALGSGNLFIAQQNYAAGLNAVVELGTGNTAFTRAIGTGAGQVNIGGSSGNGLNSGGFASVNGTATVNLGGAGAAVTWGSTGFFQAGGALYLGSPNVAGTVDFQNGINLGGNRTVTALDGSAAVDGIISGQIRNQAGGGGTARSLTKNGTGTLALTNSGNDYSGGTTVSSGTLLVNNGSGSGTGSGAVIVNVSTRLGGTGTIAPTGGNGITVGGILAPGASIGNLTLNLGGTTGTVAMASGASFEFELGSANPTIGTIGLNTSDLLTIAGASANDFSFNSNNVDFLNTGSVGFYKLFDTSIDNVSTWIGLDFDETSGLVSSESLTYSNLADGLTGNFLVGTASNGGTTGDIYFQVIPEPSAALLGCLGMLATLRRRR